MGAGDGGPPHRAPPAAPLHGPQAGLLEAVFEVVANVGPSTVADAAYWLARCEPYGALEPDDVVSVRIGEVTDYYKHAGNSAQTLCSFLTGQVGHKWSSSWRGPFVAPVYSSGGALGGSAVGWPPATDGRDTLAFWGTAANTGGCCHAASKETAAGAADPSAWGQSFRLGLARGPLPGLKPAPATGAGARSDGEGTATYAFSGTALGDGSDGAAVFVWHHTEQQS